MAFFRRKKSAQKPAATASTPFLRLMELTREIHSTLDLDRALEIILDGALELTRMQRGFIMLYDEEEKLTFRMGRTCNRDTLGPQDFQVSSTLYQKAIDQRELYFFHNMVDGPSSSASRLQIICGVCVPLFASRAAGPDSPRKIIGALYADSRVAVRFRTEEREITSSLALHAGLALDNASLFDLAVRDGLTRLYQRRYFDSLAGIEWKRTQRYKRPLSILLLDLDLFKSVNDTYGHAEGDRVLRTTAEVLRSCGRTEDVTARYGGEEFIMLLPETDQRGAELVASRILEAVPRSVKVADRSITLSIGVASYPTCGASTLEALIKAADAALYGAKSRGRNRSETAPES